MPTIHINNADVYYEIHGEGQPLILVHGYTVSSFGWRHMIPTLSKHFKVVIFDNRGVGQTKDDGGELSVEQMADDVIALSNALNLKKPNVAGISMGGSIAQMVGIRHSDKINKLGIIVSAPKWRAATVMALTSFLMMREQKVNLDISLQVTLSWCLGEGFLSNDKKVNRLIDFLGEEPSPQTLEDQKRQFGALKNFDVRDRLNEITAPTVIFSGIEDVLSLREESKYLADNISGATLREFPCGHMIHVEMPDELSQALINCFI